MNCTPVLYAEDAPEDVDHIEEGLARAHPGLRLQRVKNAHDAIHYLQDALKPGHFTTHPLPKTRAPEHPDDW